MKRLNDVVYRLRTESGKPKVDYADVCGDTRIEVVRRGRRTLRGEEWPPQLQKKSEPSNWKAILIVVASVLFAGAIIYGSNCLYVCKLYMCGQSDKKYSKMDSCTNV
ncbi:unnamed protein product [Callosobruchus maculatus]|uniref:Uncharacterized protein n=1 Tax=Callosobruchus maculatus TaxID=64391 RepID=A0A653DBL6_CALMS|nr:unnamed protein product [Callosobruchus maculatus]